MNNERVSIERRECIASRCFSAAFHCDGSGAYRDELVALAFGAYRAVLEATSGINCGGFQPGLFHDDFDRFREIFVCTDVEHRLRFNSCVADCRACDGTSAAVIGSGSDRHVNACGKSCRRDISRGGEDCSSSSMAVRSDVGDFVDSGFANQETVTQATAHKLPLSEASLSVDETSVKVGKWREKNRRKREARKRRKDKSEKEAVDVQKVNEKKKLNSEVPLWRRKKKENPFVSDERSLKQRLSESLAARRIAENELSMELAKARADKIKAGEVNVLSDKVSTWTVGVGSSFPSSESHSGVSFRNLPRQERVEQWVNPVGSCDSGGHAQSSSPVNRCATLPSSSADLPSAGTDRISVDSGEIRTLIKAKTDVDYELECALKYIKKVEPLVEEKFIVPACASTEEANEDLYFATGYVRPEGDVQKMLRSCSQECDIRDVPHAERFDFRLKQIIERNRLNIDCGF